MSSVQCTDFACLIYRSGFRRSHLILAILDSFSPEEVSNLTQTCQGKEPFFVLRAFYQLFERRLSAFTSSWPEPGQWVKNHPDVALQWKASRARSALRFDQLDALTDIARAALTQEIQVEVERRLMEILEKAAAKPHEFAPILRNILLSSLLRATFLGRSRPTGWRLFYLVDFNAQDLIEALARLDETLERLAQHLAGEETTHPGVESLDRFVTQYQQPIWEAVCAFVDTPADREACFLAVFRRLQQDGYAALRAWDLSLGQVYLLVLVKNTCLAYLEQTQYPGRNLTAAEDVLLLRMVTSSLLHNCVNELQKSILVSRLLGGNPEPMMGRAEPGVDGSQLAQAVDRLVADARVTCLQAEGG